MDNSFKSLIESASSLLILLPVKPYFDQVAAGLSLYLTLQNKKNIVVMCPSPMLVEYNKLVGVDKVATEIGNKNLQISLGDYPATNIERVSYDIEGTEFKLVVIPKNGINPPTKGQVLVSHSGVNAEVVVLIGGAMLNQFPAIDSKDLAGVKLVHIGVRELTDVGNNSVISFARPGSSVSEVVGALIKESEFEIDADAATNLLQGIESGSRSYSSDYVTADTFQMAADLIRAGGKRIKNIIQRPIPKGAMPGNIFTPKQSVQVQAEPKTNEENNPPKDWLSPKIYKGTSVS